MFFNQFISKKKHKAAGDAYPHSLATQFKGLLNALLICTSLVTGTVVLFDSYDNIGKIQLKSLLQESHLVVASLEEYLENLKGDLHRLSTYTGILGYSKNQLEDLLNGTLNKNRAIISIVLLDNKGNIRIAKRPEPLKSPIQNEPEFKVPFYNHTEFVSPVYYNQKFQRKEVIYATPTRSIDLKIDGVMITQLNLKYFERILRSLDTQTDSYIYILDSYQKIIALGASQTPAPQADFGRTIFNNFYSLENLNPQKPYRGIFGHMVMGYHRKLNPFGWVLVAEQSTDVVKKSLLKRAFIVLLILSLSSLLISTYFSHRLIYNILSPLAHLLQGIRNFQSEKKPFIARYQMEDEIGTLSKAFAELTCQLSEAMNSLMEAHDKVKKSKELAEQATLAKSEFLAVMSHEIRTPLNAIIGLHGFLLQGELSAEQRKYAAIIQQNSNHLLTLINDILDFSRLDANKMTIERHVYSVREVVEQTLDMISLKADAKDLELAYSLSTEVPHQVLGDPSHLRQILLNLLSNSIKFTNDGKISITVRNLTSEDELETDLLEFTVSDTGIGITDEQIAKLFLPFVQVDSSHTRVYGGTGLGLAISKKIVTLSGGTIRAQRNKAGGSDFIFTLQLGRVAAKKTLTLSGSVQRVALFCSHPVRISHMMRLSEMYRIELMVFDDFNSVSSMDASEIIRFNLELIFIDFFFFPTNCEKFCEIIQRLFMSTKMPMILLAPIKVQKRSLAEKNWPFVTMLTPIVKEKDFVSAINHRNSPSLPMNDQILSAASQMESSVLKSLRILLVEDNPVNQMVIQMQLNALGCQADSVANGQEALESSSQKDYDVILMDIQMPILNGYQATQKIRSDRLISRQPYIIALTAAGDHDTEKKLCLEAGMNAFASKPLSIDQLKDNLIKAAKFFNPSLD